MTFFFLVGLLPNFKSVDKQNRTQKKDQRNVYQITDIFFIMSQMWVNCNFKDYI